MSDDSKSNPIDQSRRKFLKTSGTTAAAGQIGLAGIAEEKPMETSDALKDFFGN